MNADKLAATAIIKSLPWVESLTPEKIKNFVDHYAANEPSRLIWHAKRLQGFGCSELGGLVADYIKQYDERSYKASPHSFTSAREVVNSKLLTITQIESMGPINRGVEFEDIIRSRYLKQLQEDPNVKAARDLDAIQQLQIARDSVASKYPWLKGDNVDDILQIDGKRYIVDYKFPKPGEAAKARNEGVPFDYLVQLEGYGIYAEVAGIKIDGLILAPFDFEQYKAIDVKFNRDTSLQKTIIEAGEHYWKKYLLQGQVPDFVSGYDALNDPKTLTNDSRRLSDQLAVLTQLQTQTKKAADALREQVKQEIMLQSPQNNTKFSYGLIDATYKEKSKLNTAQLVEIAELANVDLTPFIKKTNVTYEADKLYEYLLELKEQGYPIDLSTCIDDTQDVSVSITRVKKGARAELKEGIVQSTEQLVDGYLSMIKSDLKELDPLLLDSLIKEYDYHNNRQKRLELINDIPKEKPVQENASSGIASPPFSF